jgi:multicomponent Na+:H+ antiporter subunit C
MMHILFDNFIEVGSIVLFAIGFTTLLVHNNLIKKIIGLNIMDTSVFLYFISIGYIDGARAPIFEDGINHYVNPIPSGLMLTGIVVAVSVTAFALALTMRLHSLYGTLELDEIMRMREETI